VELYYAPPSHIAHGEVTLEGEEHAHLMRVMRKRAGQEILVADGEGTAYTATITSVSRLRTCCRISATYPEYNEPREQLTLAVGMTKQPARFDVLVEKATEIGVRTVIPLLTRRTIRQAPRTERWRGIALAAMKQSQRARIPRIGQPATLPEVLSGIEPQHAVILHESSTGPHLESLRTRLGPAVTVLVGPEGGFTEEELQDATGAGCLEASLGTRRLRTETAAVVAAALLLLGSPLPVREQVP
jgi:16S rRNA (uracil1498-N3)-methyltransferase